jgi:ppGpp synthetase/RelA/SpoT-type nucleotidyltranferase
VNIIDEFLERYLREYDFYLEASRLCAQQCETGLESLGIRAIVTHRAKRPDRLKAKLNMRNTVKGYQTVEEIYTDIPDLAGVRIALYFPGDRPEVQRFVDTQFQLNLTKDFPESKVPKENKRFSGYWATHNRVQLRETGLQEPHKRFCQAHIEIQVASVLMHAWAEVEHDLVYKPFTGELSPTEYAILDELNGLVLSGEIALETLQRAVKTRVSGRTKERFNNHYELAAFLYGAAHPDVTATAPKEPILGRVDILFRFIQLARLDRPELLRKYLGDLDPDTERRSVSDQIADHILSSKPDDRLLQLFLEARRAVGSRSPYATNDSIMDSDDVALGFFMSRWIAFESIVQTLTKGTTQSIRGSKRPPNIMARVVPFVDQETLNSLYFVRDLRNRTLHGSEPIGAEQLTSAGRILESALTRLIDHAPTDMVPFLHGLVKDLVTAPGDRKLERKKAQ